MRAGVPHPALENRSEARMRVDKTGFSYRRLSAFIGGSECVALTEATSS
jgi:hypothetical protein